MTNFDVYLNSAYAGRLSIDRNMRMAFSYDEIYVCMHSEAISLTMPLNKLTHSDDVVFPFIENLLPEGEIRTLIQRQNKIEEGNYAKFIELLGGDVAGALSIQLEGNKPKFEKTHSKNALTIKELSKLLIDIQNKPFNISSEKGKAGNRLSLAGAQNKLPVIRQDDKTYEATDGPSTHIIKPPRSDNRYESLVYNEFVCMKAAKLAGIETAEVSLLEIEDTKGNESDALLITRYDRMVSNDHITKRIQQEDLCQLCSIPSTMKYEVNGGPGFKELFLKIKQFCKVPVKNDLEAFKRLIFNLVVGNYDAHAKNFSLLIHENGEISLSPAYDIVCTALYEDLDTTFAMFIGGSNTLSTLKEESFKQLFKDIDKKYNTIKPQLNKMAEKSLHGIEKAVSAFIEGDFYPQDIERVKRILAISKTNYRIVINALK